METIKEITLRELVEAKSVQSARVIGRHGGFTITVCYGESERTLVSSRGDIRIFASLNTTADFLGRFGLTQFEVDATNYKRARLRAPRPDRAEALRKTRTKPRQMTMV